MNISDSTHEPDLRGLLNVQTFSVQGMPSKLETRDKTTIFYFSVGNVIGLFPIPLKAYNRFFPSCSHEVASKGLIG